MGAMLPSRIWTQQPQQPIDIDWSNPITRDLIDCFSGNSLYSPVTKTTLIGTPGKSQSFIGVCGVYNETALNGASSAPIVSSSEVTLLTVAIPSNITSTTRCIFGYGNTATTNSLCFLGSGASSGQISFFIRSDSGTTQNLQVAGPSSWTNGTLNTLVGTHSQQKNMHSLWCNGVLVSSTTATTIGTLTVNRTAMGGLRRSTDGLFWGGRCALALSWNRSLSDIEIKSISDNPWQIFKPIQSRIFANVAGGATAIDLTAANFSFSSQSAQFSFLLGLLVASFNYQAKQLQNRLSAVLSASSFSFSANSTSLQSLLSIAAASFSFAANAIDLLKATIIELTSASFSFVANAIQATTAGDAIFKLIRRGRSRFRTWFE